MRAKIPKPKKPIFCYSQDNPQSLVMLYSHQHVLQNMMKQSKQNIFIWIAGNTNVAKPLRDKLHQIQEENNAVVVIVGSLYDAGEYLGKNRELTNIIVICQPGLVSKIDKFDRRKQIAIVIKYPAENIDLDQLQQEQNKKLSGKDGDQYIYYRAVNQEVLLKLVKKQAQPQEPAYKQLMNFVSLNDHIWNSNVLIRTMRAMLNQQIDLNTRRQIVSQFSKLATKINKDNQLEQLVKELHEGPLTFKRALYWYTDESEVYKIINNLLRSSSHPSQVFYLQPLFKDIFKAIQQLYKNKKKQNFTCFRRGLLDENQFKWLQKNVGHIVKNLSFMSTSMNQQITKQFQGNAFFEIIVPQHKSQYQQDQFRFTYGYANITSYSAYYGEEQILFNPLCSFRIIEVKRIQNEVGLFQYFVKIQYGGIEKIIKKKQKLGQSSLALRQKTLCGLAKQWENEQFRLIHQGHIFVKIKQCLQHGFTYWKKYQEIAKELKQKIMGLIYLSQFCKNEGAPSLKFLEEAVKLFKDHYGEFKMEQLKENQKLDLLKIKLYYEILILRTETSQSLGNYLKVKQICQKQLSRMTKKNKFYVNFLSFLAHSLLKLSQYDQARQLFVQICQITLNLHGEYSLDHVDSLMFLSRSYTALMKFQQAYRLLQKCSQILLLTKGERHLSYHVCLAWMAENLHHLEEHSKARLLFEKNCQLTERSFGKNSIRQAKALQNLFLQLRIMGNHQQAKKFRKILKEILSQNSSYSKQSALRYISHMKLSSELLLSEQKYEQALQIARKCYKVSLETFEQNHPTSLKCLQNVGRALIQLGKLNQAESILKRCCKIQEETVGEKDIQYIISLNYLADVYLIIRNFQKALSLREKCVSLIASGYGENHRYYFQFLICYAAVLRQVKQYQKAEGFLRKCYHFNKQFWTQAHPSTIRTQISIAKCLFHQKKMSQAIEIYEQCYKLGKQVYGEINSDVLQICLDIVMATLEMGDGEKAIQVQKKYCQELGVSRRQYPSKILLLGQLMQNLGKNEQALSLSKQVLKLITFKQRDLFFELINNFACIHSKLGNYRKSYRIRSLQFKIRSANLQKKKKKLKKNKVEVESEQKWRKQKRKVNHPHNFMHFHLMQ